MPFTLLPEEWEKALAFFREHPDAVKFSKKVHNVRHSFIKLILDGVTKTTDIFALSNTKHDKSSILGMGAFGRVKRAKNRANQVFALKVEGGDETLGLLKDDLPSLQVARSVGFFKGQNLRVLEKPTWHMEQMRHRKRYTLLELIEGKNLYKIIKHHQKGKAPLTQMQLHLIGLVCATRLFILHEQRIIHGDVKAENFVGQVVGNNIKICLVDYDFSFFLPKGQVVEVSKEPRGSILYAAPELKAFHEYSFASDIYALGVLFKYLELHRLSAAMIRENPRERPMLAGIITYLAHELLYTHGQDVENISIVTEGLSRTRKFIEGYLRDPNLLYDLINYRIVFQHLSLEHRFLIGLVLCQNVLAHHKTKRLVINIRSTNVTISINPEAIIAEIKFLYDRYYIADNIAYLALNGFRPPEIDEYSAPESKRHFHFSYASDVYALGKILQEMGINPGKMIAENIQERSSLAQAMAFLIEQYGNVCFSQTSRRILKEIKQSLEGSNTPLPPDAIKTQIPMLNLNGILQESLSLVSPNATSSTSLSPQSAGSVSPMTSSPRATLSLSLINVKEPLTHNLAQLAVNQNTQKRGSSLLLSWLQFKGKDSTKEKKENKENKHKDLKTEKRAPC